MLCCAVLSKVLCFAVLCWLCCAAVLGWSFLPLDGLPATHLVAVDGLPAKKAQGRQDAGMQVLATQRNATAEPVPSCSRGELDGEEYHGGCRSSRREPWLQRLFFFSGGTWAAARPARGPHADQGWGALGPRGSDGGPPKKAQEAPGGGGGMREEAGGRAGKASAWKAGDRGWELLIKRPMDTPPGETGECFP